LHINSYLYNSKTSAGIIETTLILVTLRTAPKALRNRKRGAFGSGGRPDKKSFFKKLQLRNKLRVWSFSGWQMIRMIQTRIAKDGEKWLL
jgi:hypothetical protein